jgi:hypothetical protein
VAVRQAGRRRRAMPRVFARGLISGKYATKEREFSRCGAPRADVASHERPGRRSLVSRLDTAADPVNENAPVRTSAACPEEVE